MNYNYSKLSTQNGISISELSLHMGSTHLLEDTDLTISQGINYGLISPNGRGKTSLLNFINEKIKLDGGNIHMVKQEDISPDDHTTVIQELLSSHEKYQAYIKKEKQLNSYLESELTDDSEEAMEIYEQKQEELNKLYEYARSQRFSSVSNKAKKILAGIGFDEEGQKKLVKEYSGGWRMRISIAKALFNEPDIMILDEPTNHLDLNAVIWLTDYLQNWNKKKNTKFKTLVLVSHDKYFLDGIVDKIIRINQQKLKYYNGNHRKMLKMIQQERKEVDKKWNKQRKSIKSKKERKKKRPPLKYAVDFTFAEPHQIQKGSIFLEDVTFQYPGTNTNIFEELDFSIDSNEKITIVGHNGAGKSTLLKMLFNEITQEDMEEGTRLVNGKIKIAKYDQHFNFPMEKTPVEYLQSIYTDWSVTDIRKHLSKYNLESKAHVIPIGKCSGGQKSRLAFSTLSEASILILDEPTNHLDMETIDGLSDALEAYEGGVVLVSHDVRLIEQLDCVLYVCEDQQIKKFDGDFYDYKDKILEETQLNDSDSDVDSQ